MKSKINQYSCVLLCYNLDKSNIQSCAYLSWARLHNVTNVSAEILHGERNRQGNEVLITDLVSFEGFVQDTAVITGGMCMGINRELIFIVQNLF